MSKLKLPVIQPTTTTTSSQQQTSLDDLLDGEQSYLPNDIFVSFVEAGKQQFVFTGEENEKVSFVDNRPKPPTITKEHVSYSEIATWMECSFRHKLKYVDGIGLDGPSEHTEFGQVIHDVLEGYLERRVMPELKDIKTILTERFSKLENGGALKEKDWHDVIEPMLLEVPTFMETSFPGWEFVASEHELLEPIASQTRKFKGFIDGVIKVPKKPKKSQKPTDPVEYEYHVIDWKTTSWGWALSKKIDPKKTMQLALYKHFYATKFGVDIKSVKCHFVLLKRSSKKERCELVTVSVGEKAIEKALDTINQMLGYLKKGFFPKNRDNCKYCVYHRTEHCP